MEKKISVIIPNFNGKDLLLKNLPHVINQCSDCEIIVVDDASTDDSVSFIRNNFKKIKLIINKKNLGFARSVNTAVQRANGDLVLLLNSDVSPRSHFLSHATRHFNNSKKPIFAVGLADHSHEDDETVTRGRGGARFQRGFLNHFALTPKSGQTLWVSGGSGLFDKEAFIALGGFDPIYAPFYWEDIDLCYRAQKQGMICLFEPDAKVDHFHQEGAIKKSFSPFWVKTVSYKNQFLFVWKNISDYLMLSQHILWLLYHMVRALMTFDWPFFIGFFWAISKIPQLIFSYELSVINDKLTDKEVLKKFEKS